MYGLPMRSFFYLAVVAFVPSGQASSRNHGNSVLRNIRQEAGKIANAIRGLNISAVRVLESLRQHEESSAQEEVTFQSKGSCSRSIERLFLRLFEEKVEAIQMIDASSVYQSGLTFGNIWDLGSFDECLKISVDEQDVQFIGQHCLVDLNFRFKTLPLIDPGELADVGTALNYWFSVCMPSTCKSSSLEHSLSSLAKDADFILHYLNYSIEFVIDESNCHTSARQPLSAADIFGILMTAGLLGVAVMCTVIDVTFISPKYKGSSIDQPKACQYVSAFSMYSNGKRLLDMRVDDDTVQGVHSLKFIGIVWISVSYHVKVTVFNPLSNILGALDFLYRWTTMIILNVPCAVDVFFITSGVLNTYWFFTCSKRRTFLGNLKGYLHRYIRLTPAYAVMILVTATWLYRLQSGPVWDVIVGEARRDCDHYWWSGLLYINNYVNPTENCMFQSWYLAVDMQLFWLSPIVLYFLWRWPKFGFFIIALLISFSVAIVFYITYDNELKVPVALSYDNDVINNQLKLLYMPTHTNTIAYILGMLCGGLLYQVKRNKTLLEIHAVSSTILWLLTIAGIAWSLVGDFSLYQFDTPFDKMNSSLFTAFYRLVWSLAMFWVIVACNTGHAGPLGTILSLKMWIPLSRLTYCIFLTHAAVILYTVGSLRGPQYFSYMTQITTFAGELVIAIILAVILYLAVEAPATSLEILIRNKTRKEANLARNRLVGNGAIKKTNTNDSPGVHLSSTK